jgi:hypothetical protein
LQRAFIAKASNNQQRLNEVFAEIIAATDCITFSTPNPKDDIKFIEMIMENTEARGNIYKEINAKASGQTFGGDIDPSSACSPQASGRPHPVQDRARRGR